MRAFRDMHPGNHSLFVVTGSRNSDRLRPQFGGAGVFSSRVLKAQLLHERSIHLLYGGVNEVEG